MKYGLEKFKDNERWGFAEIYFQCTQLVDLVRASVMCETYIPYHFHKFHCKDFPRNPHSVSFHTPRNKYCSCRLAFGFWILQIRQIIAFLDFLFHRIFTTSPFFLSFGQIWLSQYNFFLSLFLQTGTLFRVQLAFFMNETRMVGRRA